jgi:HlyD family secretion protein
MKRTQGFIAAAVLLLGMAAYGVWQMRGGETPTYRTAAVEQGRLEAAVAAAGTVRPVVQVSVGSQVSGQIKELLADFNTEVRQGQLIARIDPQSFEYQVRQARADVDAAQAQVLQAEANVAAAQAAVSRARLDADNAQRDLQRRQDLLNQQFISPAEFEAVRNTAGTLAEQLKATLAQLEVARAQAASARAAVKQREASLAQANVNLERTEIRSPVDGVVIKRSVDVGQTVAASLQAPELFILARNLADMQVEVSIDEADIGRLRPGQPVSFTVDAFPGRSYEGRVGAVRKSATVANNVVTYTVVVAFSNSGAQLLPGMTANVRIVTDVRENVVKLPNAALRVRLAGVAEPAPAGAAASAARAAPSDGAARPAPSDGAPAQPGGPLAAFRAGLAGQVGLSAEQLAKVDELTATLRPRFAALRELPDEERSAAGEKLRAELRSQVAALLTEAQRPAFEQLVAETSGRGGASAGGRGRVYLLGDDGQPRAVAVRLGIGDGSMTELIGGGLQPGQQVVVGTVASGPVAAPRPRSQRAPF